MQVAVIGLGSWGTAIAGLAAEKADRVVGWAHSQDVVEGVNAYHVNPRYLTGYTLPENVVATTSLDEALAGAESVIMAVPSVHLRTLASQMAVSPSFDNTVPVCVLTKGIEPATGLLMTQIVEEELGETCVAGLSGPNHAEEICRGLPAAAVVASSDPDACAYFRALLLRETFRIYTTSDVVGVEACGALKNVMAIACGIASGMGLGDNTLAVLMTRGLAEMTRIATAMGADAITCMGLAGMGDLVVTCTSRHSRNRTFGEELARGVTLSAYEARTHMVVEGARACYSASELAEKLGVDAPLTNAVRMILDGTSLGESVQTLLSRNPKTEFYGLYGEE